MIEWTEAEITQAVEAACGLPAGSSIRSAVVAILNANPRVPPGYWLAPDEPDAAINQKVEEAVVAERAAIAKWHEEQATRLEEISDASSAVHYSILTHKRSAASIRDMEKGENDD